MMKKSSPLLKRVAPSAADKTDGSLFDGLPVDHDSHVAAQLPERALEDSRLDLGLQGHPGYPHAIGQILDVLTAGGEVMTAVPVLSLNYPRKNGHALLAANRAISREIVDLGPSRERRASRNPQAEPSKLKCVHLKMSKVKLAAAR